MRTKIMILFAVLFVSIADVGYAGTYNVNTCAGNSVTIGNVWPGGTIYIWNTVPTQYGVSITVNPPTNQQYIVTVLDAMYSVLGSDTFNVIVNPIPNATITGSSGFCPGTTVQLTASGGSMYHWSNNATTPTITVGQANTYTVTVTDTNGCADTTSQQIVQLPAPQVYSITTSTPYICQGSGGTIPVSGSQVWAQYEPLLYGASTGITAFGTGNPFSFTGITTPGSYTVRAINQYGCQAMMIGIVHLVSLAPAGNAGPITGPTSLCLGAGNQSYSISPISGATGYVWSISNGTIVSGQGTTSVTVSWIGNGNISVYGQNYCGAGGGSVLNVLLHAAPTVFITPINPHVCAGQSVNFTATGASTYNWSGPNGMGSGSTYTASAAGIVSVIGISQYGCMSQPATTTVYVEPTPTFTTLGPNGPICEGSPLQLTATATPVLYYSWTGPNGYSSTAQNPIIPNTNQTDAGTYLVTATSQWGCQNTGQVIVSVNPTPIVSVSAISPICAGDVLQLVAAYTGTSIHWTGPNGFTSNQQNPTITQTTTVNTGWYIATTVTGSCSAKDSVWVTVNSIPTINLSASTLTICGGQPVTLTGSGANTYNWSTGQNGTTVVVYPTQTTWYTVVGTNQYGCTGSQSIQITVGGNVLQSIFTSAGMVTCPGGNDGWANLSVLNGNYPYTYNWSPAPINGQGNNAITGLHAGVWNVVITDANGCQGTNSVTITEPPAITIAPIVNGQTVTVLVTGGTPGGNPDYIYNWMPSPASGQGTATASFPGGVNIVTVIVTDGHYCQEALVINLATAGVDDNEITNFSIYPNPVSDILYIETGDVEIAKIQLYDITGKMIYSSGKETSISMGALPTGMYILTLTDETGRVSRSKVVKQ